MTRSRPYALPELPDPRVATESAKVWAQADARLSALLEAGIPQARALLRWGSELLRAGQAADAVTAFRAAAALSPAEGAAWTSLGIALDRAGDAATAVACLEHSVGLARDQPDTWLLLGIGREKLDDVPGAEADYRVALELAPSSAAAWKCLGALLDRKRDLEGAIAALQSYVVHGAPDAAVFALLGKVLYEDGRLREANDPYTKASALEPKNPVFARMARRTRFLRDVLEGSSVDAALATFERGPLKPASSDNETHDLLDIACGVLSGFGHHDAALRVATRWAELWPGSASARYLLASLEGTGGPAPPRSPDDYIVESFDAFAAHFDEQLVGVLGYDVPQKLCALVGKSLIAGRLYDALDAGCGTGLCGPLIRPMARHLTGVDLSRKMLDLARARGVYDTLVCEELTAYLERSADAFDLIVSADVLIYFGDLQPLLDAAARALRPSGLFAVSYETTVEGERRLGPSGRFAHAASYVTSIAARSFDILDSEDALLRREGRKRVKGQLLVLRRRTPSRS
jgi:predicted TPR repeat methyltransferase